MPLKYVLISQLTRVIITVEHDEWAEEALTDLFRRQYVFVGWI